MLKKVTLLVTIAVAIQTLGFAACPGGRCEAPPQVGAQLQPPEGLSRERQTGPNNVPYRAPNNAPQEGIPQQQPAPTKLIPAANTITGTIQWTTDYKAAVAKARRENKAILLFFTGSDWCGWCQKLKSEVLSTTEFASMVGNRFVFVELDFPMNQALTPELAQQNRELKQTYGVTGYPTVIILDSNQNLIGQMGYQAGGGKAYAESLLRMLAGQQQ